jgi:hypothetical protein
LDTAQIRSRDPGARSSNVGCLQVAAVAIYSNAVWSQRGVSTRVISVLCDRIKERRARVSGAGEKTLIPTALLFSRYRAFREFTRLELAPLTVIIGKNGGGKSVLTRLPLLLASGLDPEAEAPLDLGAGGVSHSARFEDLIYQRSAQPFCLGAEISENGRTLRFVTTLRVFPVRVRDCSEL